MEEAYYDYLYDCHVANRRLTQEDWFEYGREEHHAHTPSCEGGELSPLNSISLTTYQHWVAGVLQSELWNRKCYAMVPKGVLPAPLEEIRLKWDRGQLPLEHQSMAGKCVPLEHLSRIGSKGGKAGAGRPKAKWTPERRAKTIASLKRTLAEKRGQLGN